ncbi:hypothetical protein BGZ60DRAFT_405227 [Tricladium varicosporioides]|nr:hypothetical protein BGZ60DRAFT_405227 [Hymenoscyphus varicosporioides]
MGPSRKRSRLNPPASKAEASTNTSNANSAQAGDVHQPPAISSPSEVKGNEIDDAAGDLTPLKRTDTNSNKLKTKGSWYGTWPRKSAASTQIARETILADKSANGHTTPDLSRFESKRPSPSTSTPSRPPSMYLGKSKETINITMGGTIDEESSINKDPSPKAKIKAQSPDEEVTPEPSQAPEEISTQQTAAEPDIKPAVQEVPTQRPATSSGWLGGWLSTRPAAQNQEELQPRTLDTEPTRSPEPSMLKEEPPSEDTKPQEAVVPVLEEIKSVPTTSSSWFGLWSTAAPSTVAETSAEQIPIATAKDGEDTVMEDTSEPVPQKPAQRPTTSSSWAFWSTEAPKKGSTELETSAEIGEVAATGEIPQNSPELAKAAAKKPTKKGKSSKRDRPQSMEIDEVTRQSTQPEATSGAPVQSSTSKAPSPPNLLMPSVKQTYRLVENPSILQQIARLLLRGHQQPTKHVFLAKDPPKIRTALAIGIHGLFPAPLLRTVIGQPTGTSIRFANHAAAAIRRWTDSHGCVDCEIEKVALEGEGKIADRVDNLWKLLLNWIDHVRKADFILVACHSQGVPVALMLVAKLIEFGVVASGKIGVCAMAGVSLGPFPDYKSRLFSGSAGELFEFADPESVVSKRYEDSLRIAMQYGVKVTYCGSIDDQLVSMESSTFSTASHPYIYRAVFVDGRIHAPDFLSHLVGFALKLRNLGVSDHGLIRELSAPLAGSLYTGEGHSRLYDDGKVYDLAVEFALETTTMSDIPLDLKKYEIPNNVNPYVLPWIMRGLLEEDFVKTELSSETTDLLKQFDDWKPSTKVLKDVKYRLEAVRSKL